jgi:hypothetical protein
MGVSGLNNTTHPNPQPNNLKYYCQKQLNQRRNKLKASMKNQHLLITILFTTIILLSSVNHDLPYEQDQGSKAAKIINLTKTNTIFQPLSQRNFYRDHLFSLYYMLLAVVYKFVGGNIYLVMNMCSVFMGIIFFTSLSILLNKALKTSVLINWIVFFSMPGLTTIFLFGNEVAFSLSFFILSLVSLTLYRQRSGRIFGASFFCASLVCRPDIIFLFPFWLGWLFWIEGDNKPIKQVIMTIFEVVCYLLAISIIYWVIFIRKFEIGPMFYTYNTNIKLFISYITYPFNLTIVIIGVLKLIQLLIKKNKIAFILPLLLLPVFYYIRMLTSYKFALSLAFLFGIPAVMYIDSLKNRGKTLALALICIWYFVSVTPFGIVGFRDGANLYIPSADGAIPSGSYIWFYKYVHDGFYSAKYRSEIESIQQVIQYHRANPEKEIALIGRFNTHFLLSELAASEYYFQIDEWIGKWHKESFPDLPGTHFFMLQRSYLSLEKMPKEVKDKFLVFLETGRIKGLDLDSEEERPFPLVIETGDLVPKNNDPQLASRILFAYQHYDKQGFVQSNLESELFRPTFWIRKGENSAFEPTPIYEDNEWECYQTEIQNSSIWVTELPTIYFSERNPNE